MAIDTGDTAWMLVSTALVLLMTPGLAFFYGGQVRARSALNMMMMSYVSMGIVGIIWVCFGYSMTFGTDLGFGLLGNPREFLGLSSLLSEEAIFGTVPTIVFAAFQAMFAVITVALVSGAVADRMKFGSWVLFSGIWVTLVYFPIAHWVFDFDSGESDPGGWIANNLGAIDFAGGTAVHINAGVAALAIVLVLGRRVGFGAQPFKPHNLTMVMLGAALLWFGWFGFNSGSAIGSNYLAGVTFLNTIVSTSAGMLAWLLVEKIRDGHSTTLGAASGIVAGLVGITPACSSVTPIGAIFVGAISSILAAFAVGLKYRFGYDDALDVVGVHLVAGLVGSLLVGLFASSAAPAGVDGLFYGGGIDQLIKQAVACLAVIGYCFIVTYLIAVILDRAIGLRAQKEDEISGIDLAFHAESAYELGGTFKGGR